MGYRRVILGLAAAALLAAAVGYAQHIKKGSVAVIRSEELDLDLNTGSTEMTGNVRVDIKGGYTATMTASSVSVAADLEKAQVLSFEARGPVKLVFDTTNKEGKPLHVVASCSQKATFSEQTMIATMEGNAHAEVTGAEAVVSQIESAKYDGDSMTIDLNQRKIKVKQATAEVHMAPEVAPPAEQGTP